MCIMCSALSLTIYLLVICYFVAEIACRAEFTNFKCNSTDKDFCDFEYCYLKSVNRSHKYLALKAKLFKVPVTRASLIFGLYKRFNGYRPFLYNFTVDVCKFYKKQKSFPIVAFFYDFFKDYSNMNHSCPYNHDLVVDTLTIEHINNQFSRILSFPEGDYLIDMQWLAYDIHRAVVKVYFTLS